MIGSDRVGSWLSNGVADLDVKGHDFMIVTLSNSNLFVGANPKARSARGITVLAAAQAGGCGPSFIDWLAGKKTYGHGFCFV